LKPVGRDYALRLSISEDQAIQQMVKTKPFEKSKSKNPNTSKAKKPNPSVPLLENLTCSLEAEFYQLHQKIMTDNNKDVKDLYKTGQALISDIMKIVTFSEVDTRTGKYIFIRCQKCNGPKLGDVAEESECTREKYTEEEVSEIISRVTDLYYWDKSVARLDTRPIAIACELCGNKFNNRSKKKDHIKSDYKEFWAISG
jgi:hypothetical protein